MKEAFISDIHAGYMASKKTTPDGLNVRENDGYEALEEMVTQIIDDGVDNVVVGGDVFHTPTPTIRSIVKVQEQFRRLSNAGIPVYALAGNHDATDIRADVAASRTIHDPERKIFSHVEPYVKYDMGSGVFIHLISHHMYSDQAETMGKIKPVDGAVNILSTHGGIIDDFLKMKLSAEKSPREVIIPDFLLKDYDWDYVHLGHIHERGWVGSSDLKTDTAKSKIYYNGSLIRRGFSDKEVPLGRGWTLWEIDQKGNFKATPKQVRQRPQFDFDLIDATGDMSADEVTELIVARLKETQVEGSIEFDYKTAPTSRQKLIISPSKYSALDRAEIDKNSKHALTWDLNKSFVKTEGSRVSGDELSVYLEHQKSTNVLEVFDSWVTGSSYLETIANKKTKEEVSKRARGFVQMGQDTTFEEEES